jgi:hypothetical protein
MNWKQMFYSAIEGYLIAMFAKSRQLQLSQSAATQAAAIIEAGRAGGIVTPELMQVAWQAVGAQTIISELEKVKL